MSLSRRYAWQARGSKTPAGLRGRIVQFTDIFRAQTRQPYGLLVTEAAYSQERSFQTIIPIDDAQEYDANDPRWVVAGGESLSRLTLVPGAQSACFLVPLIQFCHHRTHIERVLPVAIDEPLMARIDEVLTRRFQ